MILIPFWDFFSFVLLVFISRRSLVEKIRNENKHVNILDKKITSVKKQLHLNIHVCKLIVPSNEKSTLNSDWRRFFLASKMLFVPSPNFCSSVTIMLKLGQSVLTIRGKVNKIDHYHYLVAGLRIYDITLYLIDKKLTFGQFIEPRYYYILRFSKSNFKSVCFYYVIFAFRINLYSVIA